MGLNTYSDISSFVNSIYEDALFAAREMSIIPSLVTVFSDQKGLAARKAQEYNKGTMNAIGETDDLNSDSFTPSALSTLTPSEVGEQFFLTDSRIDSDPFAAQQDATIELGSAMADKISGDLLGDFSSLTGGTIGAAGTVITWGYLAAGITVCRNQVKNNSLPLVVALHPFQWHVLAKSASVAGASLLNAPELQNQVTNTWKVAQFAGATIYTDTNISIDSNTDAYGAVFAKPALALDMRRAPRLEWERDASRRGIELNFTAVYAHGVWRPKFGVQLLFDAATPSS